VPNVKAAKGLASGVDLANPVLRTGPTNGHAVHHHHDRNECCERTQQSLHAHMRNMTEPLITKRADHPQAGFGLIEVMVAVLVTTAGVLAAASGTLAIYAESNRSREDTDRALAARQTLERSANLPFSSVAGGQGAMSFGSRRYVTTEAVGLLAPRLKSVQVAVASLLVSPTGRAPAVFETRVVASRPLPAAP